MYLENERFRDYVCDLYLLHLIAFKLYRHKVQSIDLLYRSLYYQTYQSYKNTTMKEEIPIGQFKTHCYKILEQSQKDHKSFIITKRGKSIARIIPLDSSSTKHSIFGIMKESASVNGDIVESLNLQWNAENE